MYRTYRELYRGKVEIVSLGVGPGKIKLPRGTSLGLDTVVLGIIGVFIPGLPCGWLVTLFLPATIPIPPMMVAFLIGIIIAIASSRADPQGKTVVRWIFDSLRFIFRARRHNGWKAISYPQALKLDVHVHAVENSTAYSSEAEGTGNVIKLHRPLSIRIKKNGQWTVSRSGNPLEPGKYRIQDGELVRSSAPVLKRKENHS